MRKKIVVKLLAVVMAMTMALGSGMTTVFAADSLTLKEADALFAEHMASCTHSSEGYYHLLVRVKSESDTFCRRYYSNGNDPDSCRIGISDGVPPEFRYWKQWGIEEVNVGDIFLYYVNWIEGYRGAFLCQVDQNQTATSASKTSTPKVTPEQLAEEAYNAAYWANQATMSKEAALPVATFTSEGAVNAIPVEAKATGAAYNLSSVTTPQGFAAAVNKLSAETTNATLAVYSSKMITFTSELLDEIEKTGKTFEYSFELEGHIYKITIPAGAKVDMDGQRFVGPLYIGAQLGTSQVIK